jgi:hypothetical protein
MARELILNKYLAGNNKGSYKWDGADLNKLLNNYINDLLCLPLLLAAMTFVIRLLKIVPFSSQLGFIIFFYFEYYLPELIQDAL